MPKLSITNRENETIEIDASAGISLMENIRNAGLDELLALCGGCCSCATCHVYIENDGGHEFAEISVDENELLASSDFRRKNSRLACQIMINEFMASLSIVIAPEE